MKTKVYLFLFIAFTWAGTKPALAQANRAGESMLSFGVGYSTFNSSLLNGVQPNFSLPELGASVDYFVINMYSIGVNVAYQSARGNYYNYYGNPSYNYNESVDRVNVSVRSIVHFIKNKNPDFYGGIRLGYAYYNYTYSNPPYMGYNNNQPLTQATLQAFVGVRAIITEGFSTYLEVGTGTPYIAEMGFSFSFGGKPQVSAAPAPASTDGPPPYVH